MRARIHILSPLCWYFRRLGLPYLDESLPARQRSAMSRHLATCLDCQGEVHKLSVLAGHIRSASPAPHQASAALWLRLAPRLIAAPASSRNARPVLVPIVSLAAIALCFAAYIAFSHSGRPDAAPPTRMAFLPVTEKQAGAAPATPAHGGAPTGGYALGLSRAGGSLFPHSKNLQPSVTAHTSGRAAEGRDKNALAKNIARMTFIHVPVATPAGLAGAVPRGAPAIHPSPALRHIRHEGISPILSSLRPAQPISAALYRDSVPLPAVTSPTPMSSEPISAEVADAVSQALAAGDKVRMAMLVQGHAQRMDTPEMGTFTEAASLHTVPAPTANPASPGFRVSAALSANTPGWTQTNGTRAPFFSRVETLDGTGQPLVIARLWGQVNSRGTVLFRQDEWASEQENK
jgi:hypothetical protein